MPIEQASNRLLLKAIHGGLGSLVPERTGRPPGSSSLASGGEAMAVRIVLRDTLYSGRSLAKEYAGRAMDFGAGAH